MKKYPQRKSPVGALKDLVRAIEYIIHSFTEQSLKCPHRDGLKCGHNLNNVGTCEWPFCKLNEEA